MPKEQQSLIDQACAAIGPNDPNADWRIAPTRHAEALEAKAPPLAERLRGSHLQGLAKMFEERDAQANLAQKRFKRAVTSADWAIFATASFGALLLAAAGLPELFGMAQGQDQGIAALPAVIGVLGVISGALASMWLSRVRGAEMARRWSDERAKAEAMRLRYFKEVMRGEKVDALLVFEYTRRFLLDSQIEYFLHRGGQHDRAADAALRQSTLASAASSVFIGVAGLLAVAIPRFAVLATLGVIASAYSSLATSRSALSLDRRNAGRYRLAAEQLSERKLKLDDYRQRIAAGDTAAMEEFFEPVFVVLEADHKEFLNDREQRETAIGSMEKRLDEARKALENKSAGSPAGGPSATD